LVSANAAEREKYLRDVATPKIAQMKAGPFAEKLRRTAQVWPRLLELPEELLDFLVDLVAELPFERLEDRQVAEQLLAGMIREGATSRSAFFTPQAAVDLILEVANPVPGERVYDPCFGAANLLVSAARRLGKAARQLPSREWDQFQSGSIFGVELYPEFYFVGMVRVVLGGIDHPNLELGDALDRPRIRDLGREGFDCIVANPPWRSNALDIKRSGFDVPTTASEGLFVQHIMESLRPGGRAVVAVPAGFLFRPGPERRIRKALLENYCVDGVIGLPANTFKPYTSIASALLVFRRARPADTVRFLNCDALQGVDRQPDSSDAQLPLDVAKAFRSNDLQAGVWTATTREIANRDWDLSPRRTGAQELDQILKEISSLDPTVPILSLDKLATVAAGVTYKRSDVYQPPEESGETGLLSSIDKRLARLEKTSRLAGHRHAHTLRSFVGLPKSPPTIFSDASGIPLVRAGDIEKGKVSRPDVTLINPDLESRARVALIESGDVVMSISGSIGKIGIVGTDEARWVASRSVSTIRLRDQGTADPHYLAAILRAQVYQSWFSGHARGSVIQNLSVRALRSLRIPVPSLQIQHRVLEQIADSGADGVEQLIRILAREEHDPVALWLEKNAATLSPPSSASRPRSLLSTVEALARELPILRNSLLHSRSSTPSRLEEWAIAVAEAVSKLDALSTVPAGTARVSMLERARFDLTWAATLTGMASGTVASRAREFNSALVTAIEREIADTLGNVRIEATLRRSRVFAGVASIVTVALRNTSGVPIRNFRATTAAFGGHLEIPFLDDQAIGELLLSITSSEEKQIDFSVKWNAERLDGVAVSGEIPLSLLAIGSPKAADPATLRDMLSMSDSIPDTLGPNPYITGTPVPVHRMEMFFGRSRLMSTITRHLANPAGANVILLEGNRRAGKSSILLQLEHNKELKDWIVARCDFQGAAGHATLKGIPTDQVFIHLACAIADAGLAHGLKLWPPSERPGPEDKPFRLEFRRSFSTALQHGAPFEIFREFLDHVLETISPKRLLLLLDEFDRIQEGIDSGVTSSQVPQNIRFLLNNYPRITAILTGSQRMTQMRKEYWSVLFGLGHRIGVTAIDPQEAANLVVKPAPQLVFPPSVVVKIRELCANQPYLIQCLCSRVFDNCAFDEQGTVTLEMVESAALELVHGLEHFEAFWDFAGDERARYILCIVHRLTSQGDLVHVTLPMIEDELESSGVAVSREELVGDELKKLVELELISMERDGQYRLTVPLLAMWISRNKDCEDQKERAIRESKQRSLQ
jgi:type I restriction enzyme M protein